MNIVAGTIMFMLFAAPTPGTYEARPIVYFGDQSFCEVLAPQCIIKTEALLGVDKAAEIRNEAIEQIKRMYGK